MVVLPECFNVPYDIKRFRENAERDDSISPTHNFLQQLAKDNCVYVVGGSYITKNDRGEYFNTCHVFGRDGQRLGTYNKMNLFDLDVHEGNRHKVYRESSVLTAGSKPLVFETEFGKMGVGICFDLRFPDLAKSYRDSGCKVLFYPGAFTMSTGVAHYELLLRSTSLNNQLYMVGVAPARDTESSYVTWSNSTVTGPWGELVDNLGHDECSKVVELDLDFVDRCRTNMPIHR